MRRSHSVRVGFRMVLCENDFDEHNVSYTGYGQIGSASKLAYAVLTCGNGLGLCRPYVRLFAVHNFQLLSLHYNVGAFRFRNAEIKKITFFFLI